MDFPKNIVSLQDAVKRLPQDKIAKYISVLLVVYLAFLSAKLTWLLAAPSPVSPAMSSNTSGANNATEKKALSLTEFVSLNIFGLYNETAQPEVVVKQVKDAPETKLQLTLAGVVSSNSDKTAAAIIEHQGKQETYGIGENIVGTRASLEAVFSDRVHIKQSGRVETLMLDGFEYTKEVKVASVATGSTTQAAEKKPVDSPKRKPEVVDKRTNKILSETAKKLKNDLANDPGKITDYLKISPKYKDGAIMGYMLRPGKDPEFFRESGLKHGDIAVQMNGFDLTLPLEGAQALKALKTERDISLQVLRGDSVTDILFSIDN